MAKGSVSSGRRAGAGDSSYTNARKGGAGAQPVRRARDKTRRSGVRLLEDPANDERLLGAQLKRLGLYAANTLGDGSCLFRALSDQMYGNPNYHLRIRHEVCEFLLEHQNEFIAFIDDSSHSSPEAAYAAHIAEMRLAGTYGTQVEIVAFARMYRRRVKVIQAELVYVIGYEDESPMAKAKRAMRSDSKGKGKQEGEDLPSLYIVYHNWEHYSSARNLQGPHTGLPCIIDQKLPASGADPTASLEDEPLANQEESIILSSLRYPHRHNVTEIRKLIHDHQGQWEQALEYLLENEMDETESEDFNNPSPQPPPDLSLPPPSPMHLASNSALPQHLLHDNRHPASGLSVLHRSSSPSASSSTATSTTHRSASTTATHLSDYVNNESDLPGRFDKAESASTSPSCASSATRVRSRAVSTDQEILASESPRQRFRITREAEERDDSSSVAGEDLATIDSSSVVSVSSASNEAESDAASAGLPAHSRLPDHLQPIQRPASVPLLIVKRGRGRPPKKRDGLTVPKQPTRRQRKQFAKASGSPIGGRTRSKLSPHPKEENGLQREFKELFV